MDTETAAWYRAKAETCPRRDSCLKLAIVLDKDITDAQKAEVIGRVCGRCTLLNGALDLIAFLLGAGGLGFNAFYWAVALQSEYDAVRIYVNQVHEGVGELVMFTTLTIFVIWRALRYWWKMFTIPMKVKE